MASVQTSYAETISTPTAAGAIATGMPVEIASYEVEDTTVDFGVAVKSGTAIDQCKVGVEGNSSSPYHVEKYLGVTVINRALGDEQENYKKGNIASVAFRGDIWVKVESAVAAGGIVTVDETTGKLSDETAADEQFLIPNARWLTAAAANGLAKLRLDSPQKGA